MWACIISQSDSASALSRFDSRTRARAPFAADSNESNERLCHAVLPRLRGKPKRPSKYPRHPGLSTLLHPRRATDGPSRPPAIRGPPQGCGGYSNVPGCRGHPLRSHGSSRLGQPGELMPEEEMMSEDCGRCKSSEPSSQSGRSNSTHMGTPNRPSAPTSAAVSYSYGGSPVNGGRPGPGGNGHSTRGRADRSKRRSQRLLAVATCDSLHNGL